MFGKDKKDKKVAPEVQQTAQANVERASRDDQAEQRAALKAEQDRLEKEAREENERRQKELEAMPLAERLERADLALREAQVRKVSADIATARRHARLMEVQANYEQAKINLAEWDLAEAQRDVPAISEDTTVLEEDTQGLGETARDVQEKPEASKGSGWLTTIILVLALAVGGIYAYEKVQNPDVTVMEIVEKGKAMVSGDAAPAE